MYSGIEQYLKIVFDPSQTIKADFYYTGGRTFYYESNILTPLQFLLFFTYTCVTLSRASEYSYVERNIIWRCFDVILATSHLKTQTH